MNVLSPLVLETFDGFPGYPFFFTRFFVGVNLESRGFWLIFCVSNSLVFVAIVFLLHGLCLEVLFYSWFVRICNSDPKRGSSSVFGMRSETSAGDLP